MENFNKYWKVHYNNFDNFVKFISRKFTGKKINLKVDEICHFSYYYHYEDEYLYLCLSNNNFNEEYILSYTQFNSHDEGWLKKNNYEYMGEFLGRKQKLERLNNINKIV